jgi:hypothetical protein
LSSSKNEGSGKKEVIKLIEDGIIYHISDNKWVSHVHCVPKKGGITVVPSDENKLVAQHTVTSYRMRIDFRILNKGTRKDYYSLPFIDQMLERLFKHSHFCYLDGYSGFPQIHVHKDDQENTTFTCPFGTFAYRKTPFGLCNAPATFQRCIDAIFADYIEKIMEFFMDDYIKRVGTVKLSDTSQINWGRDWRYSKFTKVSRGETTISTNTANLCIT